MSNVVFFKWIFGQKDIKPVLALLVFCFVSILSSAAFAQAPTPDANAPAQNQATVGSAPNGVPQVDIVTPDQHGTSHNIFQNYNVGSNGLILNNSAAGGQSQLGGLIGGNGNLTAGSEASLILNEVTGGSRSQLLGPTEIFGVAADFILANPYGVTCNGCGFINTPRATLSTGRPVFATDGSFLGLDVYTRDLNGDLIRDEDGNLPNVLIGENGVDVKNLHYFDIIARSIVISGLIEGDSTNTEIGLFAGINSFNYQSRTATVRGTESEGKLEFGIDSSLLGGAYANRITLIGTEDGVGMRAPKAMRAAYGGIHLTSKGRIVFGKATSEGTIKATSETAGITVEELVYSEIALELTADKGLSLLENAIAGAKGNVTLKTASLDLAEHSLLGAGIDENGTLVGNGRLTIEAADLVNRGEITASDDITITSTGQIDNDGNILSENTLSLLGGGVFNNRQNAIVSADGALEFDLAKLTNSGEINSNNGPLVATVSGDLINTGTIVAGMTASLDVAGGLNNSGSITSIDKLTIANANLNNSGTISSQSDVELNNLAALVNSGTLISEGGSLTASILGDVFNSGEIKGSQNTSFSVAGNFTNDFGATVNAGETLLIKAKTLDNLGDFPQGLIGGKLSGQNINLEVDTLNNFGDAVAGNNLTIKAKTAVFNVFGTLEAGNRVDIAAVDQIENLSGIIRGKNVNLAAAIITNIDIVRREDVTLLPEIFLARLKNASTKMVEKAVEVYKESFKGADTKAIDALRAQLSKTAQDVVNNTTGDVNHSVSLDRIRAALISDLTKSQTQGQPKLDVASVEQQLNKTAKALKFNSPIAALGKNSPLKNLGSKSNVSGNYTDRLVRKSEISASENIKINAGKEFTAVGGKIAAGNDLNIKSGGTTSLSSRQLESYKNREFKGGHEREYLLKNELADISAGGKVTIEGQGGVALKGTKVTSGGDTVIRSKTGEVALSSVIDKRDYDYYHKKKYGFLRHKTKKTVNKAYEEKNVLTSIASDGKVLITSDEKDVLVRGTNITAQGDIRLTSGKQNVILAAVADIRKYENYTSKSSFFGLSKSSSRETGKDLSHQPTFVSAQGDVILDSASGDLTVKGSIVEAKGDIKVIAQNVNINAVHDEHYRQLVKKKSGFFFEAFSSKSSVGYSFGWKDEKHVMTKSERLAMVSGLFADGSIVFDVENDFTSEAASIIAGNDLIVNAGGNIALVSAYDYLANSESHKVFQIGYTQSVQENVSSAIDSLTSIPDQWNAGAGSETNRVITKASTVLRTIDTVTGLVYGPLVSASASIGYSSSKSRANSNQQNAQVGEIQAGRDVLLTSGLDMTLEGTQVSAGRHILLDAANDLNIQSALSSFSENSSSKESSASIGMSVGVGFQGVTVSGNIGASFQKSKSSASGTNHKLARLSADKITLKSGKDTKVKGAKVKGRKVTTDVDGDLTVESVQNTYQLKSNSSGGGLNLGIGLGGSSTLGKEAAKIPEQVSKNIANNGKGQSKTAGVSANFSKGSAERAWVDELTEITATEELNINVKGNTHLKGAVIAAVSGNLHLKTGTFTYEDIIDYDRSKNIGGSLNLSHSFGGPKGESQADKTSQTMAGVSDAFKRSSFGVDGFYEKKDKEGITRATVGTGTLNVQDKTKQAELENTGKTQKLANINRDLNATQEITKDERSYVGVYVTDTSVKRAIEGVEIVGRTLGEVVAEVFKNIGKVSNPNLAEVGAALDDGRLTTSGLINQLATCGSQQGFNLFNLIISRAHAATGCLIKDKNGKVIRRLTPEDNEKCKDVLALLLTNKPLEIDGFGQNGLSLVAIGRDLYYALGRRGAVTYGDRAVFVDENGNENLLADANGDPIYYNALNNKFFVNNKEVAAADGFILATIGIGGATTRIALKGLKVARVKPKVKAGGVNNTGPRFLARSDGQILDTSKIVIPGATNAVEGKTGFLLGRVTSGPASAKSAERALIFRDKLGFNDKTLLNALKQHLRLNFARGTLRPGSHPSVVQEITVKGPITGPSGTTQTITSGWSIRPNGSVTLNTAF
jgi:filamentous hemagglutinin family protein